MGVIPIVIVALVFVDGERGDDDLTKMVSSPTSVRQVSTVAV